MAYFCSANKGIVEFTQPRVNVVCCVLYTVFFENVFDSDFTLSLLFVCVAVS